MRQHLAVERDRRGALAAAVDAQPLDIVEPDHVVVARPAEQRAGGRREEARHGPCLRMTSTHSLPSSSVSRRPAPGSASR